MKMSEYVGYDALGLAELVKRGEVSAQELQQTAQAAVEAVNPAINAVVEQWTQPPAAYGVSLFTRIPKVSAW